jgi:hypothetical protein
MTLRGIRWFLYGFAAVFVLASCMGCATAEPGTLRHMKRVAFQDCTTSKYRECIAYMDHVDRHECSINTMGCEVYVGGRLDHNVCSDFARAQCLRYLR